MKSIWMIAAVLIIAIGMMGNVAALPATVHGCAYGALTDNTWPAGIRMEIYDTELAGVWEGWCLDPGYAFPCNVEFTVTYDDTATKTNALLNTDMLAVFGMDMTKSANKYIFMDALYTFEGLSPSQGMTGTQLYQNIVSSIQPYKPGCDDCYEVILKPEPESYGQQPIMICVPVECPPEVPTPEFPTLAVPVGMLLGLLAIVFYSRR